LAAPPSPLAGPTRQRIENRAGPAGNNEVDTDTNSDMDANEDQGQSTEEENKSSNEADDSSEDDDEDEEDHGEGEEEDESGQASNDDGQGPDDNAGKLFYFLKSIAI
jgi:hypothetical protein